MISQIFKQGGGAGIGSRVIVIKDGELQNVRAEIIRGSYDNGENLYLSIIDDSTEEALLPLTGYVDNEGVLHLSGRDFDDNKTYEFTIDNRDQSISLEEVEGVTIGETTIPTEGGGGDVDVPGQQATTTVIVDPTTNINHRSLSSYSATLTSGAGYWYYHILRNGEECSEEDAMDYMEYMTGSRFLPTYNYEKPQNSIFIMPDQSMWKPQYLPLESAQFPGLNLFKMYESPVMDLIYHTIFSYDENENTTSVWFLPSVLPLRYYSADTEKMYYFDYENKKVIDENKNEVGTFDEVGATFPYIVLLMDGEIDRTARDHIDYMFFDGDFITTTESYPMFNTYDLFHQKKQYKHSIEIRANNPEETGGTNYDNITFNFVCSESSAFTYATLKSFIANGGSKYINMQPCVFLHGTENKTYYNAVVAMCMSTSTVLTLAVGLSESIVQASVNPSYTPVFYDIVEEL